jgi:hypothetical protein
MARPRKLTDVGHLRYDAYLLALSFYMLRDGAPGLLSHMKGGVWLTRFLPDFREDELGPRFIEEALNPENVERSILAGQMRFSPYRYRVITFFVPPTKKARKDVLGLVRRNKNWSFRPPAFPRPGIWKRLIKARTVADIRRIRREQYRVLASILYSHAEDFLRAKRLHNYPESNRPGSDDKRIQFFSKVLAGLKLGIAPATATKRLAHSGLPDSQRYRGLFSSMPMYSEVFKVRQKGEKK